MKKIKKTKNTSVISLRLPSSVVNSLKDSADKSGQSLNKYISALLTRNELNGRLAYLTQEESDFIDKIWFWDWLLENMGHSNVEAMMKLTKHIGEINNEDQ